MRICVWLLKHLVSQILPFFFYNQIVWTIIILLPNTYSRRIKYDFWSYLQTFKHRL